MLRDLIKLFDLCLAKLLRCLKPLCGLFLDRNRRGRTILTKLYNVAGIEL